MPRESLIYVTETLRYPKPARPDEAVFDGLRNFHHVTRAPEGLAQVQLESGVNGVAITGPRGQRRRPAVLIRSSPWKAGTTETPWHDHFDLVGGRATYFGDHKPDTAGPLGSTAGNKILEEVAALHQSDSREDRLAAPPLVLFRTVPWRDGRGVLRQKGAVEFLGVAVIENLVSVTNAHPKTDNPFPNYEAQLRMLDLPGDPPRLDWSWINTRRTNEDLTTGFDVAPALWRAWVEG